MNVLRRETMTLEQFLAWEERQELRYEFDGFQPIAMTGGTVAHASIQVNLIRALGNALAGSPCRVFGSHLKIRATTSIRYPDAFVVCNRPAANDTVATEPVVIFEILSPSTANEDLVVKNAQYRAAATVQRYVILEQTNIAALVFSRTGDLWASEVVAGIDGILHMPEIGIVVKLADIYEGVALNEVGTEA